MHTHYDFLYVFKLKREVSIKIDTYEIDDYVWKDLEDVMADERRGGRVKQLLDEMG